MRQWLTLFKKELLKMWRNFKWIWLPLVFIVLGMTEPLTSYYMPKIIDAVGGMPEGTIIQIPTPAANEVLLMVVNQLGLLGVLIIVLASMGVIASERKSGLAAMILVKPIPIFSYVSAKWVSVLMLGFFALFLGYLSGWYYTAVLFETVPLQLVIKSYFIFAIWYAFILTLTVFFSSIFKVAGITGFLTLGTIMVLSIATNALGDIMAWSPANLSDSVASLLIGGQLGEHFWLAFLVTLILVGAMLMGSVAILKNKELE